MRGESKAVTLCALLRGPAGFVGDHLDNLPQPSCFPGIGFVIRTVVRIVRISEVQGARRTDKVEHVLHGIAICAMGQFIRKTLNSEGVVNVGHRSEPADPDMSMRRTVFDAYVWQIIGNI